MNHFVVLIEVKRRHVVVNDPARGTVLLSFDEVGRHFTGVALELQPTPEFRRRKAKPGLSWREVIGHVKGLRGGLTQMLIVAAGLQLLGLIAPFLSQWILDDVIVSADHDLLVVLGAGALLVLVVQSLMTVGQGRLARALSTMTNLHLSGRVMRHLLRLPISFFEARHIGDIVSRFQSVTAIQSTVTGTLVQSVIDGVFALLIGAVMFIYSPILAVIVLSAIALYAFVRIASYGTLRRLAAEYLALSAKENSHFLESLRGMQSIKIAGLEEQRRTRWFNLLVSATNRHVATARLSVSFGAAYTFLFGIEQVSALCWGAHLVMTSRMSVGMLFAFISYKDQFSSRMRNFIDAMMEVRLLSVQVSRLSDIALAKAEETGGTPDSLLAEAIPQTPRIELRNVSYRYGSGEEWVIKDLSVTIEAGEHVAVIGASGCGKTTLAKLLIGLIEPTEGAILIDGIPLRQLGLDVWRKRLGVVMQDDQLFTGTIFENITGFSSEPDLARAKRAAILAGIHEEIARMPMGYHTLNGDMGSSLSGGQKQRVLLSRALYLDPAALILDEATSHLDVSREHQVNEAIVALDVTRIVIAHRPETIAMADRIFDLGSHKWPPSRDLSLDKEVHSFEKQRI
ncbi:ATP-binding cassette subfamily B protein RaxB [Paraburkholderia caledonica]|uniref:ATP-binding cassette subfamily B protein RaxB n=2 Tax=Paraburkholderia caledonica TaxID=134536 RepID=A0AB73INH9_9BURK|nr:ATP-binding cassette subfamily B protein RaxB [Paraburkholderia caledonica]